MVATALILHLTLVEQLGRARAPAQLEPPDVTLKVSFAFYPSSSGVAHLLEAKLGANHREGRSSPRRWRQFRAHFGYTIYHHHFELTRSKSSVYGSSSYLYLVSITFSR